MIGTILQIFVVAVVVVVVVVVVIKFKFSLSRHETKQNNFLKTPFYMT